MTRFIVHVGPHKTGTTYLQACFARCRPQLAERGIHYPTIWGPITHHALSVALGTVPNPKLEAQFAALHAAGHATVLISSEGLAGLPEPSIAYFKSLAGAENPLRCIFYARSWADILPSHWKESVKGGDTGTLPEYLYKRLHNPVASTFVNFGPGLQHWAKHFGADAISIVAYNQVMATKLDLFEHFAEQFLAWPQPPTPKVTGVNVSPGTADMEVIRTIAALERMRVGRPVSKRYAGGLVDRYMRRQNELVTSAMAGALEQHTTHLFINEATPTLTALHRDLMTEFGAAIVAPRLANFFFRPRRAETSYVHPDWLLPAGVLDDVRAIQQLLRAETEASGLSAEGH